MRQVPPQRNNRGRVAGDVGVLLGGFLLLLPTIVLGSAAIPAAEWEREAREVEAVPTPDGFSFRSARDSEHGDDLFIGNYHRSTDRFQFGMVSVAPEAQLVLNLTFLTLYEFRDVDGNGGYSVGDEIESRIRLRDVPRSTVLTDLQPDLQGGFVATVTYPLARSNPASGPATPGTFLVRFFIVDEPKTIDGSEAVPSAVRMELLIDGYPFVANDTAIALELRADGSPPLDTATESLRAAAKPFEALIAWDSAATQGADVGPVHVAVVEVPPSIMTPGTRNETSVLFSYPRSDAATVHPTSVGFRRPAESSVPEILDRLAAGDWRVYTLGLAGTVGLLGVTLWRRVRQS